MTLHTLWKLIKECTFFNHGSMNNSLADLQTLALFNITIIPSKSLKIISVTCRPPILGWVKANTDGSAIGSPRMSGAGGIFCNARGFVKGAFAFNTGMDFAYIAELQAAMFAIRKAKELGWCNLWLECDSTWVVNLFQTHSTNVPWVVQLQWD